MREKQAIRVNPNNVLIKITKQQWESLFTIWINRANGSREKLFKDVEETEGYEGRFKQNVSVGTVLAAGENVKGILKGDVAVLDYLVTGSTDTLVGYHNGAIIVSVLAKTTYHDKDSAPMLDGRKTWKKGDINVLSPLMGIVRMAKLKAFRPYVFLEYEDPNKLAVGEGGLQIKVTDTLCARKVIAADPQTGFKDFDKILVNEHDLFDREIDGKKISVIFETDIAATIC